MDILGLIYETIKVYFINRKGNIFATWKIIAIITCSATADVRAVP